MEIFLYSLLASVLMTAVSLAFAPREKAQSPKAQTLETPTVDAGRKVPVIFGRVIVKSPNLLYMGGRYTEEVRRNA